MRNEINLNDLWRSHSESELQFAALYSKFREPLILFALKVTKSSQQSSDIIQEVFLKLWEHRDEIGNIENMEGWLHKVAYNKILDFLRKSAADERLREAFWKKIEISGFETEHAVDARECDSLIREAIYKLPEQRRLVFQLNRENGLNYQEIADHLSISKHTVKNQMSSALRSIQRFLAGSVTLLIIHVF
jgi:RNA polymerase sigma-70 factor (family 1)